MEENIIENIKRIYENKKLKRNIIIEEKKHELFEKFPEIKLKEDEITKLAVEASKKMIFSTEEEKNVIQKNMEKEIKSIRKEIKALYKENGIPLNYLEPKYDCVDCMDTGFIEKDGKFIKCKCYNQLEALQISNISNIYNIEKENFTTFDSSYYSDESDKERYGSSISPRQNIEKIRKNVEEFIDNFETTEDSGLLFSGKPGLGKTFMSNCIAKEILEKGHSVIYLTLSKLLDTAIKFKFSSNQSESNELYRKIYNVDLLIIDDAGTENMNSQRKEELFEIINGRILNNKKTIISTNLSINDLYENYDERVISRIIGKYKKYKFFGDDIRLKKI